MCLFRINNQNDKNSLEYYLKCISTETPGFLNLVLYKAAVETRSAKLAIAPPWITLLTFDNFSSTFISTKHEPWSSGALITFHLIKADLSSKKVYYYLSLIYFGVEVGVE